ILEFFSTCRIRDEMGLDVAGTLYGFGAYWLGSERLIPDKGDLSDYWVEISSGRDFLRGAPSYTYIRDSVRRLCHRLISYSIFRKGQAPEKVTTTDLCYLRSIDRGAANIPYLLAQYLFRHAEGRKSGDRLSGGYFIRRLTHHFGLVSDDGLRGLSVVARELPLIDMGELVKLNICMDLRDDWAWVASGPERQHVAVAGAPTVAEDAPAVDEGDQAVPAPMQAPQQPPPPPLDAARTMPQRLGRPEEEVQGLRRDVRSLRGLHSMGLSEGAHLQHSSDAPGKGLARPAPPQHSRDLVKEISTNIGGGFTNLEILKCWSLETSRRVLYKVEDIAAYLVEYVKFWDDWEVDRYGNANLGDKRRAFWSLNEDILKINDFDYQYAVSIKEDTVYSCLHSPKATKETSSIRRIQRRPIRRIEDIVCEDSKRYQK
ncbi:hypothetical protein Tco_0862350, partial [Tanacetum coccineum]